jgi:hypothetical protein
MEDRLALDDDDIQRIADRKSETKRLGAHHGTEKAPQ